MRRRGRAVRAAVAAAVLLATAPAAFSSAAEPEEFTWSAKQCTEVNVGLPLPVAKLQQLLPRGFTVREQGPGVGMIYLGMAECESMTVEGKEQPRDSSADAVIPARTADGSSVMYHLWQVTGAPDLRKRMKAFGFRGALDATAAATTHTTAATATGTADVPWTFAPYSVSATGGKLERPVTGNAAWLQQTRHGTVETRFFFEDMQMHYGVGRLTVPAGSWLDEVLGGTTHEGMGILMEPYDVDAFVGLRDG